MYFALTGEILCKRVNTKLAFETTTDDVPGRQDSAYSNDHTDSAGRLEALPARGCIDADLQ